MRAGADPRQYAVSTTAFVGDAEGHVCGLKLQQVAWVDERVQGADGVVRTTRALKAVPGSERELRCDLVLLALGFEGPDLSLSSLRGLDLSGRGGTVKAAPGRHRSSLPGVFAAGDCRRGQSLVVWAIHEGRVAATQVDEFLKTIPVRGRAHV